MNPGIVFSHEQRMGLFGLHNQLGRELLSALVALPNSGITSQTATLSLMHAVCSPFFLLAANSTGSAWYRANTEDL